MAKKRRMLVLQHIFSGQFPGYNNALFEHTPSKIDYKLNGN
jgi:hypothetical protein